jgi:protein gp37
MANRISHMNSWIGEQYREVIGSDGKWNGCTMLVDTWMDFPNKYKKPKRIFVGSMTDIFLHSQSKYGRADVVRMFSIMAKNPQHTFQILTKRPAQMKIFMDSLGEDKNFNHYSLPNVWLGVTVCNQEEANFKIPILLDIPAAVRFVSIEPMLGPIDLVYIPDGEWTMNALTGISSHPKGTITHDKLDWIICGAETGPGARPIKYEWVYNLLGQAQSANIPFFFKKWGKLKIAPNQIDTFKQFPK